MTTVEYTDKGDEQGELNQSRRNQDVRGIARYEVPIAVAISILGAIVVAYAGRDWWFHADAWGFLGVDHTDVARERVFSQSYPEMSRRDRLWLSSVFSDEIDQLEVMLGRNLSAWRNLPEPR